VTPIFASSNNRRGNVTTQQRLFAAHFQDVPLVRHPVGDSVGLFEGHSDGLSVEASAGLSLSDFVECDSVGLNVFESEGLSVVASVEVSVGASTSLDEDEAYDPDEEVCDPNTDDEDYDDDTDDEDYDDDDKDPPRFCPELEKALAGLLNMRENKATIHARMRKSHWLHTPSIAPGAWENGKIKLRVRCCAPHLNSPDDKFKYTCVGCHGQDCTLEGWASQPRSISRLDLLQPHQHPLLPLTHNL
jgi:hypothetical protein